ncbi:MAG: hypothetical protein FJX92_08105 [Bacteroidetes bacterium]|nr:hypothetical protein [Bacteroidota bacterium]
MNTGLLHLHGLLRWVILILLLVTLYQSFVKNEKIKSTSLWLMIVSHVMLLIGIYQSLLGRFGWTNLPEGVSVMKDSIYRFYLVEHPTLMIASIVLITLARGKSKSLNYSAVNKLLLIALVLILLAVPWPFREAGIGRPWFPGM